MWVSNCARGHNKCLQGKFVGESTNKFSGTPKLVTCHTEIHPSLVVKNDKAAKPEDVSVPAC